MKHNASTYRNAGCRCETCTDAQRDQQWRENQARHAQLASGREIIHGASGYVNWGCRCDTCTEANKAKCRVWNARVTGRTP